jgi:small GTP-binding protein
MPRTEYIFKVILLGDCAVGKTSLLRHLGNHPFIQECMHTIGIDFTIRYLISKESKVKLQLWDTSGQERFRTITRSYYRGCSAVFLVFGLDDRTTFNNLRVWYREFMESCNEQDTPLLYVIGTKTDMDHMVDTEEGKQYATEIGAVYAETSAKQGIGIQEIFELCSIQLVERSMEIKTSQSSKHDGIFKLLDRTLTNGDTDKTRRCGNCWGGATERT